MGSIKDSERCPAQYTLNECKQTSPTRSLITAKKDTYPKEQNGSKLIIKEDSLGF